MNGLCIHLLNRTYEPVFTDTRRYQILHQPNDCAKNVTLLIALKSIVDNIDRRNAIRRSWGSLQHFYEYPAKRVFMFGNQKIDTLLEEQSQYDDILIGNFTDDFHNLTFKDSMVFTWAKDHCNALFVFKGKILQLVGRTF